MKRVNICCVLLFTLISSSCDRDINNGIIVEKFYETSRYYMGSEYNVPLKMSMPVRRFDDEDYVFVVMNTQELDTVFKRFEVSSESYNKFELGSFIEFKD